MTNQMPTAIAHRLAFLAPRAMGRKDWQAVMLAEVEAAENAFRQNRLDIAERHLHAADKTPQSYRIAAVDRRHANLCREVVRAQIAAR